MHDDHRPEPAARQGADARVAWLARIARVATATVACVTALVALACAVAPRDAWWYGLLLDAATTAVLPALVLGSLALLPARRREAVALAAAAVALGAVTALALPRPPRDGAVPEPTTSNEHALRVMTYNLWLTSPDPDLESTLELIEESAPDLLAVQEVGTRSARRLAALADYPYVVLAPRDDIGDGDGLLSRYPIVSHLAHELGGDTTGRASEYVVDVDGVALLVLNVHLTRPPSWPVSLEGWRDNQRRRLEQVDFLGARVRGHDGPVLWLGDMNSPTGGRVYERMVEELGFRDALPRGPWPGADTYPYRVFPGALPVFGIDYVFTRGSLRAERAWVPLAGGSDHVPVIAELRLGTDGALPRPR